MATAYSGWVATDDWRAVLDYSISYPSATTAKVTLTGKINSKYGYSSGTVSCVLKCGSQSKTVSVSGFSTNSTKTIGSATFTIDRTSSKQTIAVSGKVTVDTSISSYRTGKTASASLSCNAISYSAPAVPSSCSATRNSDTKATVKWTNGSTTTTTPRSAVRVERQVDGGSFAQVASLSASSTSYTDNGISANHRYRYRVRSYGSGGYSSYATSGYIYTTPAKPTSVNLTTVGTNSIRVSAEGSAPYADGYEVSYTTDGGITWSEAVTVTSWPTTISPPGGSVQVRVRSKRGSLYSAYTYSETVTTVCPPLAPTVNALPAVVAVGTELTLSWAPNHPDGTAQKGFDIKYTLTEPDGTEHSYEQQFNTSADSSYALPVSTFTDEPQTVSICVRTVGLDPTAGAWSDPVVFTVAYAPSLVIDSPASDGQIIGELPLHIEWTATDETGIAAQTVQLQSDEGGVLWAQDMGSGVSGFANEYDLKQSDYALANGTDYVLIVTVSGGSSLSVTERREFSTMWTEPAEPAVNIEYTDGMSATVSVDDGANRTQRGRGLHITGRKGQLLPGLKIYGNTRQNLLEINESTTHLGVSAVLSSAGLLSIVGTATASNGITISKASYVARPGDEYTFSCDGYYMSGISNICIYEFDSSNTFLCSHGLKSDGGSTTFVTNGNMRYILLVVNVLEGVNASCHLRLMLTRGDTAADWCPPGINDGLRIATDDVVTSGIYGFFSGFSGRSLLDPNPSARTVSGITFEPLGDYMAHIYGTSTSQEAFGVQGLPTNSYVHGATVTSWYTTTDTTESVYLQIQAHAAGKYHRNVFTSHTSKEKTTTLMPYEYIGSCFFGITAGAYGKYIDCVVTWGSVIGTEHIDNAEFIPSATYALPDIPSASPYANLASTPDGTEDVLHIDSSGNCQLTARTARYTITDGATWRDDNTDRCKFSVPSAAPSPPTGVINDQTPYQYADSMPVRVTTVGTSRQTFVYKGAGVSTAEIYAYTGTGTTTPEQAAAMANGGTYIYKRAEEEVIDLDPIELPVIPSDDCYLWVSGPVPLDIELDYPETESISVERIDADGYAYSIEDGMEPGNEALDVLPPLNSQYSYRVTATAASGATSETIADAYVDSHGMEGWNFGPGAQEFAALGYNGTGSENVDHGGDTYDFATGNDALPLYYPTGSLTGSVSRSYDVPDRGEAKRVMSLVKEYPEAWFRDFDGGRHLGPVSGSVSLMQGQRAGRSIKLDLTECQFEEVDRE